VAQERAEEQGSWRQFKMETALCIAAVGKGARTSTTLDVDAAKRKWTRTRDDSVCLICHSFG
jgi:hypothetical protein